MKNNKKADVKSGTNKSPFFRFNITDRVLKYGVLLFFVAVWSLLVFYDTAQLYRLESLSVFLDTKLFFNEMMKAPAGFLSYIASYLLQFFYYPAVGATIYVALLYVVYRLVRKVFEIPARWSLLALLPVTMLLATNTNMGYWIYYIKLPGYYYVALLGVIVVLLALMLYKKLPLWGKYALLALFAVAGYPLFGIFALVGTILMALYTMVNEKNTVARIAAPVAAVVLFAAVPAAYFYNCYTSTSFPLMYGAGVPAYQWSLFGTDWFVASIWSKWLPFVLLLIMLVLFCVYSKRKECEKVTAHYAKWQMSLFVIIPCLTWAYWYNDTNFRIELAQDKAMWDEDWERVADLGRIDHTPTRMVVINRNIGFLRSRKAGEEMFRWEDGSANANTSLGVRMTQINGKMVYYQLGRFTFCYRWCVEDAVEFGWRVEYLKHAVRSLIANGEYELAHRYAKILKHTTFHKGWAERFEKVIKNPKLVEKEKEISIPRQLNCYKNTLDVDESFVEAYLLSVMTSNLYVNRTPLSAEASLMFALIRKDTQLFWNAMVEYLETHKSSYRLPTHYQEALLLYAHIDRRADISKFNLDEKIKKRFSEFTKLTSNYKGMTEQQMAPYFKKDYGDTYWYFYFFIREIKSN